VKPRFLLAGLALISLLAAVPLTLAQEDSKTERKDSSGMPQNWPVKIFQVKYADVNQLAKVFNPFGAVITADRDLKVLSVRAPKEILAAIEEAIQRLDVPAPPAKNIDLNAFLLMASPQGPAGTLPTDLEPVVKQLKTIFNYQSFRLIGTLSLRQRDGSGGSVSGVLPSGAGGEQKWPINYGLRIQSAFITSDTKERAIRVNNLNLSLNVPVSSGPGQFNYHDVHIETSVDVHENQKVVVGKANVDNADNALILVLTARIID